ncbi:hypothetical protein Q9Q94_15495 [Uliginosibacterium sp. 31-16]|uniref:hypothetical protein n=1 Tax=Uliginosibacterium sp. 31-16 TaxID=3068315 RepID=UPI00273E5CC0|nr:hypothetical protein [Uliginosibacterium sp. 31-16]MDP5240946.1 hypothetical protein [Uliginosibacterium sp. 31-16]
MDIDQVPQEENRTLGGHRKAVYARDASGKMVLVASKGWEVEEIVTVQAVDVFHAQAEAARQRAEAGQSAALEYWMYARRMDVEMLAQVTGLWQWRIHRHLRPAVFARLSPKILARYAEALGLPAEQIRCLPEHT